MTAVPELLLEHHRCHLEHLISQGMPAEDVVAALRATPAPVEQLRWGIGGAVDNQQDRTTFLAYCLRRNRVDVLRAVHEAGIREDGRVATLRTMGNRVLRKPSCTTSGFVHTPLQAAVEAASPEGLRLALSMQREPTDAHTQGHGSDVSLRLYAILRVLQAGGVSSMLSLTRVSSAADPHDDVRRAVECCGILLAEHFPWSDAPKDELEMRSRALRTLVGFSWFEEYEEHLQALLRMHVESREFDVNAPADAGAGHRPLLYAAAAANAAAMVALIELGADPGLAAPKGDFLDIVREHGLQNGDRCAGVALVTEALLRRHLGGDRAASARPSKSRRVI